MEKFEQKPKVSELVAPIKKRDITLFANYF